MAHEFDTPFDNIESAQEYLALLSRELDVAKQETQADIAREADSQIPRRRDALRLVVYTLEKLEQHIKISRRLLSDLRTLRDVTADFFSSCSAGAFYSVMGEKTEAFEFLEAAYQERDFLLIFLDVIPAFDNIRSDPRFADLPRRMGLPQLRSPTSSS